MDGAGEQVHYQYDHMLRRWMKELLPQMERSFKRDGGMSQDRICCVENCIKYTVLKMKINGLLAGTKRSVKVNDTKHSK